MARTDGCPECIDNVEPPYVVRDHGSWYVAHYLCSDCEHFWTTSWADA